MLTHHGGLYGAVSFAEVSARVRRVYRVRRRIVAVFRGLHRKAGPARVALAGFIARGPEGDRGLLRQLAAAYAACGEKGKLLYGFDALTESVGGYWHIFMGCWKEPCTPSVFPMMV